MTREEFENITEVYELLEAAQNYDCEDVWSAIISDDGRDNILDERAYSYAQDEGWRDLLSTLKSWEDEDGYDYYYEDEWDDFCPLESGSRKFYELKETLFNYIAEEYGFEDDEVDVEVDEEAEEIFDEEPEEIEPDDSGCSAAEDDVRLFVYEYQII